MSETVYVTLCCSVTGTFGSGQSWFLLKPYGNIFSGGLECSFDNAECTHHFAGLDDLP